MARNLYDFLLAKTRVSVSRAGQRIEVLHSEHPLLHRAFCPDIHIVEPNDRIGILTFHESFNIATALLLRLV